MRCNGVGGEEVGVKCGCIQGCCECARPGVKSWRCMVQVVVSMQTNRFGAAARQSWVSPLRAHYDRGWESQPNRLTGKEDTGDVGPRVVGEGMGRGNGESITARTRINR